jgi:hypothetical protein
MVALTKIPFYYCLQGLTIGSKPPSDNEII